MLTFFNRIRFAPARKGQVAIILILIVAVGLIFYAVSLNYGRISQVKTLTMTAANRSASFMGSFMMSYGETLLQEQLGGVDRICQRQKTKGGWFSSFFVFIVLIVITIAVFVIGPATIVAWGGLEGAVATAAASALTTTLIATTALALTSAVLQTVILSPVTSSMSGKMITDSLSIGDQVVEYGVSTALRGAVTDQVQIPDVIDIDSDGLFGDAVDLQSAKDTTSRFGLYLLKRTRRLNDIGSATMKRFTNALDELLDKGKDDWGMYDPVDCDVLGTGNHACCPSDPQTDNAFPAACDPCCVPSEDRPACCSDIADSDYPCGNSFTCSQRTPYQELGYTYPHVYDFYYENDQNDFVSFREQMGRDDEHHEYRVNDQNPNWDSDTDAQQILRSPLPQGSDPPEQKFFLEDTTGFYKPPVYEPPDYPINDKKSGIFPFFYKIADWGTELSELQDESDVYDGNLDQDDSYEIHWCNSDDTTGGDDLEDIYSVTLPKEIPQLDLPNTPGDYNGGQCVDKVNMDTSSVGDPPQVADRVPGPDNSGSGIKDIFEPADQCAAGKPDTGWKRGADLFCSTDYPYAEECDKHGSAGACTISFTLPDGTTSTESVPCMCGETGARDAEYWQDDNLDEIVYGLGPSLLSGAEALTNISAKTLALTFSLWYDEAAEWIEPPCPGCPEEGCPGSGDKCPDDENGDGVSDWPGWEGCTCPGSYTKKERSEGGGYLWVIRDQLQSFYDPIDEWIYPDSGYVGNSCYISADADTDAVWCVPPEGCPGVNLDEEATFDSNENGIRGDLEDVVECLNWNANDTVTYNDGSDGGGTATGNAEKFRICAEQCSANADFCANNLPRSLVPDFNEYTNRSCNDAYFISLVEESWGEAENQVAKFRKRYDFLKARLDEAMAIVVDDPDNPNEDDGGVMGAAIDKLTEFIDGGTPFNTPDDNGTPLNPNDDTSQDSPSELLIEARMNKDDNPSLRAFAIYVWQDILDTPRERDGEMTQEGYWHAVKVETRVPKRCNNACGVNGAADPPWPNVGTWSQKSKSHMTTCFFLDAPTGTVKARVTRYDEDRDSTGLKFPSGIPIWEIRSSHPDRKKADPSGLAAICGESVDAVDKRLKDTPWGNAFMLNKIPDYSSMNSDDQNYAECWVEVHRLLKTGIATETCAEYSYANGTTWHQWQDNTTNGEFEMDFVNCDSGFTLGDN